MIKLNRLNQNFIIGNGLDIRPVYKSMRKHGITKGVFYPMEYYFQDLMFRPENTYCICIDKDYFYLKDITALVNHLRTHDHDKTTLAALKREYNARLNNRR